MKSKNIYKIFLLSNNKNKTQNIEQSVQSEPNQQPVVNNETDNTEVEMVDCGKSKDPSCFLITILVMENDKCHFQRKIDDTLSLDCYFPKGTLNMDTLGQMFGNDKGMQQIVDEACTIPGW